MPIEHIFILANGATVLAALIGGMVADTWGFAVLLSIVVFVWFRGIAVAFGLLPEFAHGYALSAPWFGSVVGLALAAAALGAVGHLIRRSSRSLKC